MAYSLSNRAALYVGEGQYAKAEPLYSQAMEILKKALGPNHPDVAVVLNDLALLYDAQGYYVKAEPLYIEALRIVENSLPSDHPTLGMVMENYAALLGKLHRGAEARQWQAKAEAARQRHAKNNPEGRW